MRILRRAFILIVFTAVLVPAQAQERVRRNVEIEFEAVDGASLYEIQVIRKGERNAKPIFFKLKQPKWSANIRPGLYTMQLRSYDDRAVPGDWSAPTDLQVRLPAIIVKSPPPNGILTAKDEAEDKVNLQWEIVPGADKYQVTVQGPNGFNKTEKVSRNSHSIELPVGQSFTWNVVAIDGRGEKGEQSDQPYAFEFKGPPLPKPRVDKPLSKFVREISWQKVDHATHYSYEIKHYDPKAKNWEVVDKKDQVTENKVAMDISRPSGRYRIEVKAHGDRRDDSPAQRLDFQMRGGFRDPAALENAILRDSLVKPTKFYAIASYLVTKMDYTSSNYDVNAKTVIPGVVGGTGRIGIGYQDPESKWGGFGIVDLSGFAIGGQTFQFASMELHATRKMEFGQGGLLLFGGGIFSKELPIVLGTVSTGYEGIGKFRGMGPHVGFSYWIPFSQRYGLQFNGRAYYTLSGSASTGGNAESNLSFQYGLMGSYRLNRSWMGYAGYLYRLDEGSYSTSPGADSFAKPGQVNTISVQGHYLNLMLEFSF